MTKPVGVGFLGSQFVSGIHARALVRNPHAKLIGVASPTPGHAEAFAETYGLPTTAPITARCWSATISTWW